MNETARRVAFALNPPPDGIYDDEATMTRYRVRRGVVVYTVTKEQIRKIRTGKIPALNIQIPMSWGSYRMFPE